MTTFMHVHVGKGRATVAISHEKGAKEATVAVAFCSPNDQYKREKGRLISSGRLNKEGKYFFKVGLDGQSPIKLQVSNILEAMLAEESNAPKWAFGQKVTGPDKIAG